MKPSESTFTLPIGHIRLTIWGGTIGRRHKPLSVVLERRRQQNADLWYPAATFDIAELEPLARAIEAARAFLTDGKGPAKVPGANPESAAVPQSTDSADESDGESDCEESPEPAQAEAPVQTDAAPPEAPSPNGPSTTTEPPPFDANVQSTPSAPPHKTTSAIPIRSKRKLSPTRTKVDAKSVKRLAARPARGRTR